MNKIITHDALITLIKSSFTYLNAQFQKITVLKKPKIRDRYSISHKLGFLILVFSLVSFFAEAQNDCVNIPLNGSGNPDAGPGGTISLSNEIYFAQSFTAVGDCFDGEIAINSIALYLTGNGTNGYRVKLFAGESVDDNDLLYTKGDISDFSTLVRASRPPNAGRMVEFDISDGTGDNSFTLGQVYTILFQRVQGNGNLYGTSPNNIDITGSSYQAVDAVSGSFDTNTELVYELLVPIPVNTDGDAFPDDEDDDDDNDNVLDEDELIIGTDPLDPDSDDDGVNDDVDPFPLDPTNTDTDGDGISDNIDNCPDTPNPDQADANNDGVGDVCESAAQDNCDTADDIVPGSYTTTITQGSGGGIMGVGADAAFFIYTPTEDGSIYVNSCFNGGNADTNLNIGTGPCVDLTSIAANDDSCDRGDGSAWASEITLEVTAGTAYTIEWDDRYTSGANEFTWSLAFTPAPECTMAVIDLNASTFDDTNCNPDGTGTYTIDFAVTNAGDAGTVISDGTNTYPLVVGTVTAGPYNSGDSNTFEVTGTDPACDFTVGTFDFTCPPPAPDNVDCANAATITCGETINATSDGSTGTAEGIGCTMGVNGIWYTFIGTGGDMTVSADASFDHRIGIARGVCVDLTNIVCRDASVGTETYTFASTLNEIYYVYIAHYSGGNTTTGTIDITLTCAAIPTCDAAAFDAGTINESACNPDGTGMWSVDIFVEEVGDGGVFDDGTNQYTVVAGNVNAGPYMNGDTITIEYVASDPACSSTVGAFGYSCPLPPPANDEVAGAIDLPVGDTLCESPVLADNTTATTSVENINTADCTFAGGIPLGDVWYSVTVPSTGEVTVESSTTGGPITDTVMTMYRGTSGSLVEVGCADDTNGAFAAIALTAADGISPGDVLLVRVWEYGDNVKGTFNVCAFSPTSLGIDDNTLGAFTYYPNPVNNTLTLNAQNTIEDVTLYNMLGQVVLKATPNAVNSEVDMSALANGAYFVQVTIANTTKTVRVIKQ